jgi:hypothetical protein
MFGGLQGDRRIDAVFFLPACGVRLPLCCRDDFDWGFPGLTPSHNVRVNYLSDSRLQT